MKKNFTFNTKLTLSILLRVNGTNGKRFVNTGLMKSKL